MLKKFMYFIILIIYILAVSRVVFHRVNPYLAVNLTPFKTILYYWYNMEREGTFAFVSNVVGNILLFMPLGFILPHVSEKFKRLGSIFLISLIVSLFIEGMQFYFKLGMFDVDDLILNTLGGLVGYIVFFINNKVSEK